MSSIQTVRDKLKKLKDDIMKQKLAKVSGTSTQTLKNKLNDLFSMKNSWTKSKYYINLNNNKTTKRKRSRVMAKNNIGKSETKSKTKSKSKSRNSRVSFNFSNSPLKGSPLYDPFKEKTKNKKKPIKPTRKSQPNVSL